MARCSSSPPPLDSRPSAAWSQLSARSDPVFVPTASGEPWDLPRTFTRGVPYPICRCRRSGRRRWPYSNRCCQLAHIIPFFRFSFICRRMSLFYSIASTARIISRASTFLLLFLLSYDVLTSPLSLSRLSMTICCGIAWLGVLRCRSYRKQIQLPQARADTLSYRKQGLTD